ncbi:MAG: hypothetical protein KDA84_10430 [Planctomycetaceae bacterium]|nr:hypothetical protein [Planctomycetaceae bacterium]
MELQLPDFLKLLFFLYVGLWSFVAILAFFVGYYILFRRSDQKTAFEVMGIGWLFILLDIITGNLRYFTYAFFRAPYELQATQNQIFSINLLLAVILTLPFVWGFGRTESTRLRCIARIVVFPLLIAFLDLIVQVAILWPVLDWHYMRATPPEVRHLPEDLLDDSTSPNVSNELPPE